MDALKLVKMCNEIGAFFAAEPDKATAMAGLAGHLKRFWEPRMRRGILAHLDGGGAGLSPLAVDALRTHRAMLEPKAVRA